VPLRFYVRFLHLLSQHATHATPYSRGRCHSCHTLYEVILPVEDEELQQREDYLFECGRPLWGDALETARPDYRLKMIALEEELARIPDALQWLDLVLMGEKPRKAARRLHHDWQWYCRVLDACRRVLLE